MKYFLHIFFLSIFINGIGINISAGQNPSSVVIAGDFADPSIIRTENAYYAVGTSSEWAPHFPVYKSTDLKAWKLSGYVFDKAPEWTSGSFWAPEYYKIGNTYYIYYTARRKSDNVSCIGVATSPYPDRGFKDKGVIIDFGKEAIDAFLYNDNGQLYITYKAYGLDDRPIEILGSKLSKDGLHLEGEPFHMLKDDKRIGLEGQSIVKVGKYYYLFYSAGNCCGIDCSYNVRVSRAINFKGPYEVYDKNPVLDENRDWKCMGHGTFVKNGKGEYFYLHHAYNRESTVFGGRQALLSKVSWDKNSGWPVLKVIQQQSKVKADVHETFLGNEPSLNWQWDFRHATPNYHQQNGRFILTGEVTKDNNTGIVMTMRPVSLAFEASATIANYNQELKGLAFYGDANAALGIGVKGDSVICWTVKDNKRSIAGSTNIGTAKNIRLKLVTDRSQNCRFYYAKSGGEWVHLKLSQPVSANILPQWDRSPRIGIHYSGSPSASAEFYSFDIKYL